jgi:hypothetical protein
MTATYYNPDLDTDPTDEQRRFYQNYQTNTGFKTEQPGIVNNAAATWANSRTTSHVNGFENHLQLEDSVTKYFFNTDQAKEPPTMPGLALALNFATTQELKDAATKYDKADQTQCRIARSIQSAITQIEEVKNRILLEGGKRTQGVIFDLKNHHKYADKIEQTSTVEVGDSFMEFIQSLQGSVLRPPEPKQVWEVATPIPEIINPQPQTPTFETNDWSDII